MSKQKTKILKKYNLRDLRRDLLAALVVTAIAVPESLGLAAIVGLPPQTGLYTALLAPLVYALFASSRRLIVGADSATAALVASGAGLVAAAGTSGYVSAVVLIGVIVGFVLIMLALLRFSFLADLISRPVLLGLLAGVGLQLIIGQLPYMLGLEASGSLLHQLTGVVSQIGQVNGMTLMISVLSVGLIFLLGRTRYPGALAAILAATVFAIIFNVSSYHVQLIGALPVGLPNMVWPNFSLGDLATLLPTTLAIALVIVAQSSAVAREQAAENDETLDVRRDMLALGGANLASAITQGFAVNGSPPRTLASRLYGGHTRMVNVYMSVMIGALVLYGGGLFSSVPQAALAAIVFSIGVYLIRMSELEKIWQSHKMEFWVAMIALAGVAIFGVRQGVLIAVIVSLMERLQRQYHPHDQVLLRDNELSEWARDRVDPRHHHDLNVPGLLVYSFESSLFFENISYFNSRLVLAIEQAKQPVECVVIDAGAIDDIDYTAVENLRDLARRLKVKHVRLGFAHVSPVLRRQFDEYGVTDLVGEKWLFATLETAMGYFDKHRADK